MKKILLSVLVLWAAGAYCQEIRMPDEKRKEYAKETQKASKSTSLEQNDSDDRSREAQRERALEARKKAAAANSPEPGQIVYCIIREVSAPNSNKAKVIIEVDFRYGDRMKGLDKKSQNDLGIATEKRTYKNALEALNNFSMHGWTLTHVSDYRDSSTEMMVHDYLIGYRIP